MRVLFDDQIFSQQRFGGISRYYTELVKGLGARTNVNARLLSPLCTNHYAKRIPRSLRVGIPFPAMAGTESLIWHVNRKLSNQYIKRFRPDVLHQTYYHATRKKAYTESRIVTTVHDMIHELFPKEFPDPEMVTSLKLQATRNADLVICVSENTRKDLVRITGIDHSKTRVIHHGIDHIKPSDLPMSGPHDKPYLLYVGLRHIYKNFRRVLKAYVKYPDLMDQFDLVCFGGGALTVSEKELMSRLNIPENKVVVTYGNDQVLSGFYQHADAFLFPSLYEGFGFPPLEAMMHGCPVISSNVSSLPEVLGIAAEYFDPRDTDGLVRAIDGVVSDPERSSELIALGSVQAKKFTWERCAARTLKSYEELG